MKKWNNIFPRPGIEPGPLDSKSYTLPRRHKSRLVPQGNTNDLYIPIPGDILPLQLENSLNETRGVLCTHVGYLRWAPNVTVEKILIPYAAAGHRNRAV